MSRLPRPSAAYQPSKHVRPSQSPRMAVTVKQDTLQVQDKREGKEKNPLRFTYRPEVHTLECAVRRITFPRPARVLPAALTTHCFVLGCTAEEADSQVNSQHFWPDC